jgi:hypothetical protein
VQRILVTFCVTLLLSISVFAPIGSGQQSGRPQVGSRATPDLPTHANKPSDRGPSVTVKNGRLSIRIHNTALGRLMDEISGKAGIPIVLSEDLGSQLVSTDFQDVPLDEGLRQILSKYDAFFFYGVDEQEPSSLKTVWVYPKGRGRGIAPLPAEKWASTKDFEAMLADKDPEVRGRAIETLVQRKGEAALDAVLKSLQDPNDQVRTRALYGATKAGVQVSEAVLNNLAVNDASPDVRFLALQGLSNGPEARQIAEGALEDPSEPVRVLAREILTRLDEEANQSQEPTPSSADQQQQNQPPQDQ